MGVVARALGEDPATAHMAVDAVAWSGEEGTYTSFLGSNSFVGDLRDEPIANFLDSDWLLLNERLARLYEIFHTQLSADVAQLEYVDHCPVDLIAEKS